MTKASRIGTDAGTNSGNRKDSEMTTDEDGSDSDGGGVPLKTEIEYLEEDILSQATVVKTQFQNDETQSTRYHGMILPNEVCFCLFLSEDVGGCIKRGEIVWTLMWKWHSPQAFVNGLQRATASHGWVYQNCRTGSFTGLNA